MLWVGYAPHADQNGFHTVGDSGAIVPKIESPVGETLHCGTSSNIPSKIFLEAGIGSANGTSALRVGLRDLGAGLFLALMESPHNHIWPGVGRNAEVRLPLTQEAARSSPSRRGRRERESFRRQQVWTDSRGFKG